MESVDRLFGFPNESLELIRLPLAALTGSLMKARIFSFVTSEILRKLRRSLLRSTSTAKLKLSNRSRRIGLGCPGCACTETTKRDNKTSERIDFVFIRMATFSSFDFVLVVDSVQGGNGRQVYLIDVSRVVAQQE